MINLNCCQLGAMSRPAYWRLEGYAYSGGRAALSMMIDELDPKNVVGEPERAADQRKPERAS